MFNSEGLVDFYDGVFGISHQQQVVARFDHSIPARCKIFAGAVDQHNEGALWQVEIDDSFPCGWRILGNIHFHQF